MSVDDIRKSLWALVYAGCGAMVLIATFCVASVFLLPPGKSGYENYKLVFYFIGMVPRAAWGIIVLPSGALFFDYVTEGKWFDAVLKGNIAVAIVLSVVIFTLGMLLCYV